MRIYAYNDKHFHSIFSFQVNELRTRVQGYEESSVDKIVVTRLENKIRDLEAKLELEISTKHRLEVNDFFDFVSFRPNDVKVFNKDDTSMTQSVKICFH